jgi:hypothetical protein
MAALSIGFMGSWFCNCTVNIFKKFFERSAEEVPLLVVDTGGANRS